MWSPTAMSRWLQKPTDTPWRRRFPSMRRPHSTPRQTKLSISTAKEKFQSRRHTASTRFNFRQLLKKGSKPNPLTETTMLGPRQPPTADAPRNFSQHSQPQNPTLITVKNKTSWAALKHKRRKPLRTSKRDMESPSLEKETNNRFPPIKDYDKNQVLNNIKQGDENPSSNNYDNP